MQAGRRSWVALFTCADFTDTTGTKVGIGRQGEAAILGRPNPVRQMLWSEIMPSRYVRNHRTRRDRLGNDPPLLLIAPPSAADRARYLRAALNDLRVVTNVDHNVHTILYPKRIAIVHHSPSLSYVG